MDRFARWCGRPGGDAGLDEGALLVSAALDPEVGLDADAAASAVETIVADGLAQLDALAAGVANETLAALTSHLFTTRGFRGNVGAYYEPANSLLHHVLRRRVGIPITLSVVCMEVGRRIGVALHGVGLPGHFLVGTDDPDTFLDPFGGGRTLDLGALRRLASEIVGSERPFDAAWLVAVDRYSIVARMLANLKQIYRSTGQRTALATVLRLRVLVPGVPTSERLELADALAAIGRFGEAAAELDALATRMPGTSQGAELTVRANRFRARLN